MSKTKKSARAQKQHSETGLTGFIVDKLIPPKYQTVASIGVILVTFLIFFSPMYFSNKTFQSGDIVTSMSYETFVETYDYPLWNPYVFGGFPSAATVSTFRWFDFVSAGYTTIIKIVTAPFSVDYAADTFNLFVLALSSFLLR